MLKSALKWILVFLITLYCVLAYKYNPLLIFMLVIEILIGLIALVFVIVVKITIKPKMQKILGSAGKGKKTKIVINLTDKKSLGIIRYGNCRITLQIKNLANGYFEKKKFKFALVNTVNSNLVISQTMENCGVFLIEVSKMYISDIFNVFRVRKKIRESYPVKIMPEYNLMPIEVTRFTREFINDADVFSNIESGDDPTETFEIRPYEQGDAPGKIHWKISAKEHMLMVREKSKPIGPTVLIKLDLFDENKEKKFLRKKTKRKKDKNEAYINNLYMDIFASLMFSLIENNVVHMVTWYEADREGMYAKIIRGFEDMYFVLDRLLYEKRHNVRELSDAVSDDFLRGMQFSTKIDLDINSNLYVNEEKADLCFDKNNKLDYTKLSITV